MIKAICWIGRACLMLVTDVRGVYRIGLAGCVIAVAYLAFSPIDAPVLQGHDKFGHLLAFAVMAWLAEGGWPEPRHAWKRWAGLLSYGLLIELVQRELPYRHFSWFDFAADAFGILLYCAGRALIVRIRSAN